MNLNELKESIMDVNIRIEQLESIDVYDIRATENRIEDLHISLLGDAVEGLLSVYMEEKSRLENKLKFLTGGSFIDYSGLAGG
jgi:hypothetical protein